MTPQKQEEKIFMPEILQKANNLGITDEKMLEIKHFSKNAGFFGIITYPERANSLIGVISEALTPEKCKNHASVSLLKKVAKNELKLIFEAIADYIMEAKNIGSENIPLKKSIISVLAEADELRITELLLLTKNGLAGKYTKTFGKITSEIVQDWVSAYSKTECLNLEARAKFTKIKVNILGQNSKFVTVYEITNEWFKDKINNRGHHYSFAHKEDRKTWFKFVDDKSSIAKENFFKKNA